MKILFLSQRFLFPMDTGGKIRTGKILEQLNTSFDITIISNIESQKDDIYINRMNTLCSSFIGVPWKEIKKYTLRFYIKLFLNLFSRYPVSFLNDYSKDISTEISKELKNNKYDLIICDFLQSTLNLNKISGYPKILFEHNIESVITQRHFNMASNLFLRLFWWLQWKKMSINERKKCEEYDGVIVVSEADKKILEKQFRISNNIYSIPTGVDIKFFNFKEQSIKKYDLIFTGSMDWLPNEDAIIFFSKEIFPEIYKKIPGIHLLVVGRNPSSRLQKILNDYPQIKATGWVPDVRPYMAKSTLYIAPIRIGGGTRLKIYEAMAMGKVVVTTSVGAEGLPVEKEKHLIIADDPEKFACGVIRLLENEEEREKIGARAKDFVQKNFGWDKVATKFAEICYDVVNKKS